MLLITETTEFARSVYDRTFSFIFGIRVYEPILSIYGAVGIGYRSTTDLSRTGRSIFFTVVPIQS
jgi:hypothetical protein